MPFDEGDGRRLGTFMVSFATPSPLLLTAALPPLGELGGTCDLICVHSELCKFAHVRLVICSFTVSIMTGDSSSALGLFYRLPDIFLVKAAEVAVRGSGLLRLGGPKFSLGVLAEKLC